MEKNIDHTERTLARNQVNIVMSKWNDQERLRVGRIGLARRESSMGKVRREITVASGS